LNSEFFYLDQAGAQVVLKHVENARVTEHGEGVGHGEVALAIALVLECKHRIRANGHTAIDHLGQVHAEERANAEARFQPEHAQHPVGHQP
jgi:hypothetical protein